MHRPSTRNALTSTEIWDPLTNSTRRVGLNRSRTFWARFSEEAFLLPDGRVLVVPGDCPCGSVMRRPSRNLGSELGNLGSDRHLDDAACGAQRDSARRWPGPGRWGLGLAPRRRRLGCGVHLGSVREKSTPTGSMAIRAGCIVRPDSRTAGCCSSVGIRSRHARKGSRQQRRGLGSETRARSAPSRASGRSRDGDHPRPTDVSSSSAKPARSSGTRDRVDDHRRIVPTPAHGVHGHAAHGRARSHRRREQVRHGRRAW